MTPVTPPFTNVTAGEVSPRLEGRIDLSKFFNAARLVQNMIVTPTGTLARAPGFEHVHALKDESQAGQLIPFEYSVVQPYMLVLGNFSVLFNRDRARIVAFASDAKLLNGDFDQDTNDWSDQSTGGGSIAWDSGNGGRAALDSGGGGDTAVARQSFTVDPAYDSLAHVVAFRVDGLAGDRLTLRVGTTAGGSELLEQAYAAGWHCVSVTPGTSPVYVEFENDGAFRDKIVYLDEVAILNPDPNVASSAAVEIGAPFLAADLAAVKWSQTADRLSLAHKLYHPRRLERWGHDAWSLVEIDFQDGPWLDENTTATTLTPGATSGTGVTVTASAVAGINGGRGFLASDVGRLLRHKDSAAWGWGVIASVVSTTVVTVDIRSDFDATSGAATWQLGLWSDTTGWPAATSNWKQRSVWGGATEFPRRHDFSKIADPDTFTPGTNDNDPVAIDVDHASVNEVRWYAPVDKLLYGTLGGEWKIRAASSDTAAIAPSDIDAEIQTREGSADTPPALVPNAVLFLQRYGRKLIEITFRLESESYHAVDLTLLAEHITAGGLSEIAYQHEPYRLVWAARADGLMLGMVYNRDEQVVGWFRRALAPSAAGAAVVESIATVPGASENEVWVIVRRTIDGATRRYVEVMAPRFADDDAVADAKFMDSHLTYEGAAATVISGLDHLEGETVIANAGGVEYAQLTVSGGAVTLPAAATKAHIGLAAPWRVKPHRLDAGSQQGTARDKLKRIDHFSLHLHRSYGVKVGPAEGRLEALTLGYGETMSSPPALFSGVVKAPFDGDATLNEEVVIGGDGIFPAEIVMMIPRAKVSDT